LGSATELESEKATELESEKATVKEQEMATDLDSVTELGRD
jgi:hypothetical protein